MEAVNVVFQTLIPFLFKILGAIGFWIVGNWLITLASKLLRRGLSQQSLDPTLVSYIQGILKFLLKVVLIIAILGFFGIETTSFAAILAGAAVAIGAAWSGLLGNFASGVFLQIFRPISVGDLVQIGDITGVVKDIGMFVTSIDSADNVRHITSNTNLFSGDIKNYSVNDFRRVDLEAQLDHTTDISNAIKALSDGIQAIPGQYPGKNFVIEILSFNERGPKLVIRLYASLENYWDVYFATNKVIAAVLGRKEFPIPTVPVRIKEV